MTNEVPHPLSVVIITRNEADNIEDCIRSVDWADEVLVVDSGSMDDTVSIAESLGARTLHHDWQGFGKQKQYASDQATHDWILNLDADERPDQQLRTSIKQALSQKEQPAAYSCNFRHRMMGRWLRHGEAWPDPHVRLYDRKHAHWKQLPIHEHIEVMGDIRPLAGCIEHCTADSVADIFAKINHYTDLQAEQMLRNNAAAGLFSLLARPLWRFVRNYFFRLGFLDGTAGLVHAVQGSFTTFLKYAKTIEKRQHL